MIISTTNVQTKKHMKYHEIKQNNNNANFSKTIINSFCYLGRLCPLALGLRNQALIYPLPPILSIPYSLSFELIPADWQYMYPGIHCIHNAPPNMKPPGFSCETHGITNFYPHAIGTRVADAKGGPKCLTPTHFRLWESMGNGTGSNFRFKLVSYNVLAQTLLMSDMTWRPLKYSKRNDLAWEKRSEKLYNEVVSLDPDIICFQEVQHSHLSFYRRFGDIGYRGMFKRKTGNKTDGCAIFFKDSVFELNAKAGVEYHQSNLALLKADSIGLIVKITPRSSPNTPLVVANTHLVSSFSKRPTKMSKTATRTAQIRILLSEIERFTSTGKEGHLPLLLTGDLNSSPYSLLIEFLEEGKMCIPIEESLAHIGLPETYLKRYYMENFVGINQVPPPQFKYVCHPYKLASVYDFGKWRDNSIIRKWVTVDYIYFSTDQLSLMYRLGVPVCGSRDNIPNQIFGSDHVSLGAIFELKNTDTQNSRKR